jgi:hypothetical protein
LWDNVDKYGTAKQATDDIIWCMRFACWITKATDTHSEYAIFIPFLRQQWLSEFPSMLRYIYIACLVKFCSLHKYMHSVNHLTFLTYVFNNHRGIMVLHVSSYELSSTGRICILLRHSTVFLHLRTSIHFQILWVKTK